MFNRITRFMESVRSPSKLMIAQKFRELSVLLQAGFPLLKALRLLSQGKTSRPLALALKDVAQQVEDGSPLWRAMASRPSAFPPIAVSIVRAGEASANLEDSLVYIADTLEYEVETRNKVGNALTYPAFFVIIGFLFIGLLLGFILPQFKSMYAEFTRASGQGIKSDVFHILMWVQRNTFSIFAVTLSSLAVLVMLLKSKQFYVLEKLKLRTPVFGRLLSFSELTRFSRTLSLLVRSGIPLLQALTLCKTVMDNSETKRLVGDMADCVERGASMVEAMEKYSVVPYMMTDMVKVGEESGSLEQTLMHLSTMLQTQLERAIARLTALIQPIVLVLMGGVVMFLILGLFMPYFELLDKLQDSRFKRDEQLQEVNRKNRPRRKFFRKVKKRKAVFKKKTKIRVKPAVKKTAANAKTKKAAPAKAKTKKPASRK